MGAIKKVKGTLDILPSRFVAAEEVHLHIERWHLVEGVAREAFRRYGFDEIRTPIFEKLELFERGVGTETDVNKEMFVFETKGGERVALRPESTASVVRAALEHGLLNHSGLAKLYYIGPQFRHERPQAGRYRQFSQFGVEVLGQSDNPAIEVEVFELLDWFFKELGITDTELLINSVGDQTDRPAYIAKLKEEIGRRLEHFCGDCRKRFETNPLRVLDCKVPACQPYLNELPKITEMLGDENRRHFDEVCDLLAARGIGYRITPRLVRGLDYYTKTAFEIIGNSLGAQNTIVGGGRYDGLSESIGGPPMKGFGFASGIERIILSLPDTATEQSKESPALFIAYIGEEARRHSFTLARSLRAAGLSVVVDLEGRKLKKALAVANQIGARFSLIIGDAELESSTYLLRNMLTGGQRRVTKDDLESGLVFQKDKELCSSLLDQIQNSELEKIYLAPYEEIKSRIVNFSDKPEENDNDLIRNQIHKGDAATGLADMLKRVGRLSDAQYFYSRAWHIYNDALQMADVKEEVMAKMAQVKEELP